MLFNVFKAESKEEKEQIMNALSAYGKECYDTRKKEVLDGAENDLQRVIFLDWWNGGSLWKWNEESKKHDRAERYKLVNDHDWDKAYGWIMETISMGMG